MWQEVFNPQNYYWNYWAIPVLIVSFLMLAIGLFVLSKNKNSLTNISFMMIGFSGWVWLFSTFWMFVSKNLDLALFWNKFIWIGVPFISASVYFFSVSWLGLKNQRKLVKIAYLLSFVFVLLALKSKYFISGGSKHFWGYYPEYGLLGRLFLVFHFALMIGSFLNFLRSYRTTYSMGQRRQIKYIFMAFIVAYVASVDVFPALGIEIYPFGYICIFVFLSIISYTIIRYRALEIDTVVHRTVLWVITLSFLVLPIGLIIALTKNWLAALSIKGALISASLVLMFFVGYFNRLKPRIDHIFRRRKYDYYEVLSELGQKIGSELEIEKVQGRLFKELKEVLYICQGVLLVQPPGQEDYRKAGSLGYAGDGAPRGQINSGLLRLSFHSKLSQYVTREQKVLEREQVELDPQYAGIKEEALSWLKQSEIEVLIPIVMEGAVKGLIGIGKKENLQGYTGRDLELLEKMGKQLGVTLDNALHHGDIVEKERLAEELELGRDIQKNLLPRQAPQVAGLKVAGLMLPAKEIGGDYYDFIVQMTDNRSQLPDKSAEKPIADDSSQKLGIVIGDVSGKGVSAGLIMATAKSTIEAITRQRLTPKEILTTTNELLGKYTKGEKFMTMLYLEWDALNKKLSYSSAGHEHIIIYRCKGVEEQQGVQRAVEQKPETADSRSTSVPLYGSTSASVEVILSGGVMLGIRPDIAEYLEDKELPLKPGDKIVLYTDGITEARNEREEMYELARLTESVKKHGHKPTEELLSSLKEDVFAFIGAAEQYDDITLVVMEMK